MSMSTKYHYRKRNLLQIDTLNVNAKKEHFKDRHYKSYLLISDTLGVFNSELQQIHENLKYLIILLE